MIIFHIFKIAKKSLLLEFIMPVTINQNKKSKKLNYNYKKGKHKKGTINLHNKLLNTILNNSFMVNIRAKIEEKY
jgi:hypothetical protein